MFKKLSVRPVFDSFSPKAARMRALNILAIAGVAIGVYCVLTGAFGKDAVPTVNAQTDMFLSRRVDQIEQRFNYMESRISQIESQSRSSSSIVPRPIPNTNDQEIQFLRTQIDGLRIRLGEVECGLLHVDERTLTAAQRASRRRSAQGSSEKCRDNPASPIELSARP